MLYDLWFVCFIKCVDILFMIYSIWELENWIFNDIVFKFVGKVKVCIKMGVNFNKIY